MPHNFLITTIALMVLTAPAFSQTSPAALAPQEALVTFYSHGITVLGGLPGHSPAAFKGRIFDEDHQLAFLEPAHFVTFALTPGMHVLSATWWVAKHAKGGVHLTIDLAAGQHYFIETMVLNSGFLFSSAHLAVREVSCATAQLDNVHSKPLGATHLRPDGVPTAQSDTSFPACP